MFLCDGALMLGDSKIVIGPGALQPFSFVCLLDTPECDRPANRQGKDGTRRHCRQRCSAWPARHPLPQPLARAERPGLNWLPAQPALQIVRQSAGEEIPILGPFLQATP